MNVYFSAADPDQICLNTCGSNSCAYPKRIPSNCLDDLSNSLRISSFISLTSPGSYSPSPSTPSLYAQTQTSNSLLPLLPPTQCVPPISYRRPTWHYYYLRHTTHKARKRKTQHKSARATPRLTTITNPSSTISPHTDPLLPSPYHHAHYRSAPLPPTLAPLTYLCLVSLPTLAPLLISILLRPIPPPHLNPIPIFHPRSHLIPRPSSQLLDFSSSASP